jgi:primary-amine oxidase
VLPEQIYADGWAIGYDDRFPKSTRLQQAFLYARFSEHENLYAHPLVSSPYFILQNSPTYATPLQDFIPVIDSVTEKVIQIDFPPTYKKAADGSTELSVPTTEAFPLSEDSFIKSNRKRLPPPLKPFEFLPDLLQQSDPTHKPRDDIKPLHVLQPEGVSFKMDGHVLEWQKWKMHVGSSSQPSASLSI